MVVLLDGEVMETVGAVVSGRDGMGVDWSTLGMIFNSLIKKE
jgi:hypothetical protein